MHEIQEVILYKYCTWMRAHLFSIGETPMHIASLSGRIDNVALLISMGAYSYAVTSYEIRNLFSRSKEI